MSSTPAPLLEQHTQLNPHQSQNHSNTSAKNAAAGGKKSHACGPCRRLKRKCDLQIPCGTCKSGRNTRIDECLANPARPLNNIQELIAPNSKFGRVHRNSSVHSPASSSEDSPSSQNKKQKTGRTSSFSQFDAKHDDSIGQQGQIYATSPLSNSKMSSLDQPPTSSSIPSLQEHLQTNASAHSTNQHSTHSNGISYQQQPLQSIPVISSMPLQPQQTWNTHSPRSMLNHQQHSQNHHQPPPPLPPSQHQQHQQQPMSYQSHSAYASPTASGPSAAQIPQPDMNYSLHQQLQTQFQRIQMLESQNAESRATINHLQAELNNRSASSVQSSSHSRDIQRARDNEYKWKFIKLLPSKIQTKLLVEFYLQNIDYIYHPIHHPSFRSSLESFWKDETEVDIGWLATLFMVLCLAAIHLPKGLINIDPAEIERSHKIWFDASRECITIADSMRRTSQEFNLFILQWCSLCQLYFYATRRAEQLNEILLKAVKDCHDMGLDKDDKDNPNLLEVELKRRLWWDICGCDTFRSLSLGVKPMIRSYNSEVPFPSNCDDADITPDSIRLCSMSVPTDNSFNIYRAVMMKIMNGMFEKKHQIKAKDLKGLDDIKDQVFKGLVEIDMELCQTNKSWFFELDKEGSIPYVIDPKIHFQHHMLHTCICIHRFRIYQNYLQEGIPVAWEVAKSTAKALFQVYRKLRGIYDLKNPLFLPQIHQAFTGSVVQSMMLMLNKMSLSDQTALYEDIDLMLNDLESLGKEVFILKPEILKESFKVLNVLKKNINKNLVELEKDQKDIVSNVFGGKDMTESYLKKCTVSFIIDGEQDRDEPQDAATPYDYRNQLGALIDEDLVQKSVVKFNEIGHKLKVGETLSDRRGSIRPPNTPLFGPQASRTNGASTPQQLNINVAHPPQQAPGIALHGMGPPQSQEELDERSRHMTPFELNFNDIDTFWNDMGPQGLDELNNMYYSEFSGYKIN